MGFSYDFLNTKLHHPSHYSGGREAMSAFVVTCVLGVVFFSSVDVNFMPLWGKIFLTVLVASGIGGLFKLWIGGMDERNRRRTQAEHRKSVEAEKQKQIKTMLQATATAPRVTPE